MANRPLKIIGSVALISVGGRVDVPAKIDTGADSSSIWATKIKVGKDGVLSFALFGEGSPFYTGKILKRTDYEVAVVRSATGEEQIRYRTHLQIKIKGRKINALFNLSNRSRNNAPVLIGKRTIRGKFAVDVSKTALKLSKNPRTSSLNAELKKDPYKFYKKYHKKGAKK
ncbi:ATP-dependent zinc protease [Candidatus Saccharibacteria bacterium]|nr:ATP-dependent zinc protease [Candidatus Saccharibacteria bacterium]